MRIDVLHGIHDTKCADRACVCEVRESVRNRNRNSCKLIVSKTITYKANVECIVREFR